MRKIEISAEELELMNYNDIAHVVLETKKKKMTINELFKEVCTLLGSDENEEQSHICDLFELLSTDKRFIMLDNGYWDLKIKHNKGMVIDDEDDEDDLIIEETDDTETNEDNFDDENKSDDDIEEDDLADLVIIDDSDEENMM